MYEYSLIFAFSTVECLKQEQLEKRSRRYIMYSFNLWIVRPSSDYALAEKSDSITSD